MLNKVIKHLTSFFDFFAKFDKQISFVFLSVTVLQILSFYFTSRRFFRTEILQYFVNTYYAGLYEFLYWFLGDFILFFLVPIVLIKFVHSGGLKEFGVCLGNFKLGLKFSLAIITAFIPILWIVSSTETFQKFYPHLALTKYDWYVFIVYEIGMIFYMIGWEFIWRGYLLFGLEKKFGSSAILIQMMPFVILHFGKPVLETFGSIVAALFLGFLALRTRSFWYGVIIHFSVMLLMDLLSVLRARAQDFGIGFNSFINIIKDLL